MALPRLARALMAALLIAVVACVLTLAGPAPAVADTSDFTFDSFHADMELSRAADGHAELRVTETIVARFPDVDQNRGLVRAIPDDYQRVPLHTQVVSVTDAAGAPIPHEVDRDGDFVTVATGDDSYVHGAQTYVITYTQRDSIRAFADTDADEFYRDINGTGWEQPFGRVSAEIVIDAELAPALTGHAACYVGGQGSTERCAMAEGAGESGASHVYSPSADDLGPGETITVAIGFAPGTFVPGEPVYTPTEQFAMRSAPLFQGGSAVALVGTVGAAAGALALRRRHRDAEGRGVLVPEYGPPADITVMQAAHLVRRGNKAAAAAVIDLAVAGHLRIVDRQGGKAEDIALQPLAPAGEGSERQQVLKALFGTRRKELRLGHPQPAVAKRVQKVSAAARRALRERGLTERSSRAGAALLILASVAALVIAIVSLTFADIGGSVSPLSVAAVVLGVVGGITGAVALRPRDRVTDAGAPVRDHLLGLRDYLRLAETDRMRMLQSPEGAERIGAGDHGVLHLYERLLPYAIIFGVEKEWAQVLEAQVRESGASIDWYRGPDGFTSGYLIGALSATDNSAGPSAAWSSSGSSSGFSGGSMGGGFAGGGAGGGGGGGR